MILNNLEIYTMYGVNSCLWINKLNGAVCNCCAKTFKFYCMKKLSRDEMKKVFGGNEPTNIYYQCCLGSGDCTGCYAVIECSNGATKRTCNAS